VRRSKSTDFLPPKKDFIQAKYDFIDQMLAFGQFPGSPLELLAQRAAAVDSTATAAHGNSTSLTAEASVPPQSTPEKVKILDVGCGIGGTTRYAVCSTVQLPKCLYNRLMSPLQVPSEEAMRWRAGHRHHIVGQPGQARHRSGAAAGRGQRGVSGDGRIGDVLPR
jgi:hypothetical protein